MWLTGQMARNFRGFCGERVWSCQRCRLPTACALTLLWVADYHPAELRKQALNVSRLGVRKVI